MREMKDSGVPWIGEMPKGWTVSRVKHAFIRKNEKAHQDNPVVLSLARSGVRVRDLTRNEGQIAESYYDYNPVDDGDLLLNPMDLYSGANCSISRVVGVISPAYVNLRFKDGVANPSYYDYYFKTQYWAMAMFAHGKGVSFDNRWTLGIDTLFNYCIPCPSLLEQQRIADFLDTKCAEIDTILEKTQASIEEYKKLKSSVITEAVTKGIRGDRPMKDSCVKWIGEIPNEWSIRKIKSQSIMINGDRGVNYPGPDDFVDEGVPFITGHNIHGCRVDISAGIPCRSITKERYFMMGGAKIRIGDIVFCLRGGGVGNCAINESLTEGTIASSLMVIRANDSANAHFLNYFLHSNLASFQADFFINGSCAENLAADNVANYLMAVPPLPEQKEIAAYLDEKCAAIDSLIASKEALIEELETYKKSLIYEYVTGKKEVL